jgi:hypothetical protein
MDTMLPPAASDGARVKRKAPGAPDDARLWRCLIETHRFAQDIRSAADALKGGRPEFQLGGRP